MAPNTATKERLFGRLGMSPLARFAGCGAVRKRLIPKQMNMNRTKMQKKASKIRWPISWTERNAMTSIIETMRAWVRFIKNFRAMEFYWK